MAAPSTQGPFSPLPGGGLEDAWSCWARPEALVGITGFLPPLAARPVKAEAPGFDR